MTSRNDMEEMINDVKNRKKAAQIPSH